MTSIYIEKTRYIILEKLKMSVKGTVLEKSFLISESNLKVWDLENVQDEGPNQCYKGYKVLII